MAKKPKGAIVLGTQLADAKEAEKSHRANRPGVKSPMPSRGYDYWRGDTDLLDPVKNSLDARIAALCRKFATGSKAARQALRDAIEMGEFYTLMMFARRAAVFAMRKRRDTWITAALAAIAMIDRKRVVWRDVLVASSFVHHAAERIGLDPSAAFRRAARLAEPGTAKLMLGFIKRSAAEKKLHPNWGYQEIETDHGPGFIASSSGVSTRQLQMIALAIAAHFARDKYRAEVELNMGTPRIWLQSVDDKILDRALAASREGAMIQMKLRPACHPDPSSQHVCVFLERMKSPESAQRLAELAENKRAQRPTYCAIAIAQANLFCLLIARSLVEGVKSLETQTSLRRFAGPLAQILRRHASTNMS